MQRRHILALAAVIAVIAALSLLLGPRGSSESLRASEQVTRPGGSAEDPITGPGVPEEVTAFLRSGQSWRAARAMRLHLAGMDDAAPEAVLLAARAEAGWGGWARTRDYLEGKPWLDVAGGGDGWYWLARALEEGGDAPGALAAYERYLEASKGPAVRDRQLVAGLRRSLILLREGRAEEGAAALTALRAGVAGIEPWIDVLAAEALAENGDTIRVRQLVIASEEPAVWMRGRRALLTAYDEAGDTAGARSLALELGGQAGSASARAELSLRAARAALALGDTAAARAEARALMGGASASASRGAAEILRDLGALTTADRLTLARLLERAGDGRGAAREYRAWLAAGEGTAEERRSATLHLGRSLMSAGDNPGAIAALGPLLDASGAVGAEAMLLSGRAELARGNRARAMAIWGRLADRHPGSTEGSEGLFLVADMSHDAGSTVEATRHYRRVASDFRGTDRAGLSLMRLGGLAFVDRRYAQAAEVWEEYRTSYPTGERWLESTYWAARSHEAAGEADRATALYRESREREPLSYYALRAGERLGEPFWPVELGASPQENPSARARVEEWMRGVDLLREAGLHAEAEAEADRWIERSRDDPALLYPLAETLNDRGYTVRGIRIGRELDQGPVPNERLLRILYPFPYREMVAAEAREKDLDPFLVAALTRQESLFKARITSPAGARGLMQLMPETGKIMARNIGIDGWDAELLFQPEINVHLGTLYLADQMRTYDGSLPSVFAAYNAGPSRIDRWRKMPEYRDEELFTERIPYRETRDYVKILTRNRGIYLGLYGTEGAQAAR